jgi:uncharacterized membrane protein
MRTPASIKGHPIHAMLIAIPLGLWIFSFICDLLNHWKLSEALQTTALYTLIGGLLGALLAAVFGLIDLLSIKEPRVKKIGLFHMALNLTAVVLYGGNAWLRLSSGTDGKTTLLSAITMLILGVSGWLGGEMVYVHKIGVRE